MVNRGVSIAFVGRNRDVPRKIELSVAAMKVCITVSGGIAGFTKTHMKNSALSSQTRHRVTVSCHLLLEHINPPDPNSPSEHYASRIVLLKNDYLRWSPACSHDKSSGVSQPSMIHQVTRSSYTSDESCGQK